MIDLGIEHVGYGLAILNYGAFMYLLQDAQIFAAIICLAFAALGTSMGNYAKLKKLEQKVK